MGTSFPFPAFSREPPRDPTGEASAVGAPAYRRVMAQTGWVYRDKYFHLDSEQSHEAWIDAMREEGWRVWMARQT